MKNCGGVISSRTRRLLYVSMGHGVHDRRFIECAQESGWEVTALRCDGEDNAALSRVKLSNWIGNKDSISRINQKVFRSEFKKIVNRVKPNLIQVGPLSTAAAVLDEKLGIPVLAVSWARDLLYDVHESVWHKEVAVSAIKLSDHLLVDCESVRDVAVNLGALDESVSIVPWGVDLQSFEFSPRNSID